MRIGAAIVGRAAGPAQERIDLRWLMAYNAALGELSEAAHPLFPVCYEWPVNRVLREAAGLQALNERLVHAQHDLVIHRPPRAGEALNVTGRVVAAAQRRPGAFVVMRMETRGARGEPVTTTDYGMLYRDVTLEGGDRGEIEDPPRHGAKLQPAGEIAVAATAAHVYTECARIWNPIHTDPAYARAAGLPGIILHGTATLALSVSRVLDSSGMTPGSVRRVRCRFAGMVPMPATLAVFASREGTSLAFEARNRRGEAVIERGWIIG
jgi:acyl dehydratase